MDFENVVYCSFAHGSKSVYSLPQFSPTCQPFHQPVSFALWPLTVLLPAPDPLPALPMPMAAAHAVGWPERDSLQYQEEGLMWPLPRYP